jgi:precorrin-6A/cobalt-precorrin-6A reductase
MILLLGGTADSRAAALALLGRGYDVLLSVVGEHAADIARGMMEPDLPASRDDGLPRGSLRVRVGALDTAELQALLRDVDAVVDATHPFAEQISALAREACNKLGVPYLRLERPSTELSDGVITAANAATAAALAAETGGDGAILVTVGTRTLEAYVDAARKVGRRLVVRVMPSVESVARCLELGLAPADIVAMQGPAGAELDAALLRHFGATVLVTKESGDIGGLTAKLEACRVAGATAVVVARPQAVHGPGDEKGAAETISDVRELPSRLADMLVPGTRAREEISRHSKTSADGATPSRQGLPPRGECDS